MSERNFKWYNKVALTTYLSSEVRRTFDETGNRVLLCWMDQSNGVSGLEYFHEMLMKQCTRNGIVWVE